MADNLYCMLVSAAIYNYTLSFLCVLQEFLAALQPSLSQPGAAGNKTSQATRQQATIQPQCNQSDHSTPNKTTIQAVYQRYASMTCAQHCMTLSSYSKQQLKSYSSLAKRPGCYPTFQTWRSTGSSQQVPTAVTFTFNCCEMHLSASETYLDLGNE